MDYDGYDQRRITGHRSISMTPAWSPHRRRARLRLLLRRQRPGDLPRRHRQRDASRRSSPSGSLNTSPSFSPDGRRIAFARALGANIEIFTCRPRRQRAPPADQLARHRHQSGLEPHRQRDRVHLQPLRLAADLRHGRRGHATSGGSPSTATTTTAPPGARTGPASPTRPASQQNRFDIALVDLVTLADAAADRRRRAATRRRRFSPDGRRIAFSSTRAGGSPGLRHGGAIRRRGRAAHLRGRRIARPTGPATCREPENRDCRTGIVFARFGHKWTRSAIRQLRHHQGEST